MTLKTIVTHWSRDFALLGARMAFGGFMFAEHGLKKWQSWDSIRFDFATPFGLSTKWSAGLTIGAEMFCSLLVVIGFLTRWAALPNIICMLVAALVIHAGDPIGDRESALLYLTGFTLIAHFGPGRISVDYLIQQKLWVKWI